MSRFIYWYAECYAECRYAECRYAVCRYAECHYAECRYAECRHAPAKAKKFVRNLMNIGSNVLHLDNLYMLD